MNQTYYELDQEEQKLLAEFEAGEWVSTEEDLAKYQEYAKKMSQKNKNINIRISEKDLWKLKSKALEEGIPYQTLASSFIHKGLAA